MHAKGSTEDHSLEAIEAAARDVKNDKLPPMTEIKHTVKITVHEMPRNESHPSEENSIDYQRLRQELQKTKSSQLKNTIMGFGKMLNK